MDAELTIKSKLLGCFQSERSVECDPMNNAAKKQAHRPQKLRELSALLLKIADEEDRQDKIEAARKKRG